MKRHHYQQHTDDESKNGKQQQRKQQYETLPLYYHKFAQPYLSEVRLGFLCASEIKPQSINQSTYLYKLPN